MIIFIDIKQRNIKVYSSKGMAVFPFDKVSDLSHKLRNVKEEILLVKKANKTNVEELSEIVSKLQGVKSAKKPKRKSYSKNEELYVHFVGPGGLSLNELDEITFQDPADFKPLKTLIANGLKEAEQCQALMRSGKIEVMSAKEMQEFTSEWYASREEDKLKDEELDSIMPPPGMSVEQYMDEVEKGDMFSDPRIDDAIDIDVSKHSFGAGSGGGGGGGRGTNESTLLSEEDTMGLGGGSTGGNEGSMLPEDFEG